MIENKAIKNSTKNNELGTKIFKNIISDFQIPISAQSDALISFLSTANSKINSDEKELIELTLNSCQIMQNLIDIFLIAYKINFDNFSLEYEEFDFITLIKNITDDLKIFLTYCNLELELKIPKKIIIHADKNKLEKTIKSLIINCINLAYKNSKITIKIIEKNSKLEFQIKNHSKYTEKSIINELLKITKEYDLQLSKPSFNLGLYVTNKVINAHFGTTYAKSYSNDVNILGFLLPL